MSLWGGFLLFLPLTIGQFQQLCLKLRLDTLPQVTIYANQNCTVYEHIIHNKQQRYICYRASSFSCLGWSRSYDWQAKAMKLSPSKQNSLNRMLCGFSLHMFSIITERIVSRIQRGEEKKSQKKRSS